MHEIIFRKRDYKKFHLLTFSAGIFLFENDKFKNEILSEKKKKI